MLIKPKYRPALEAIGYQRNSVLLQELTIAFQSYLDTGKYDQISFANMQLGKIVRRHTGMFVEFKQVDWMAAFTRPPILDHNSPLLANVRAEYGGGEIATQAEGHEKMRAYTKSLRGQVDRKNGRVNGLFSQIPATLVVGSPLWEYLHLTAAEVAAVVLHELGHLFSYFEMLVQSVTMNMVIQTASEALRQTDDDTLRLQIVYEVEKDLQVKMDDAKALADEKSSDVFTAVVIKAVANQRSQSATDSILYDMRSAEFLADQFVARHGGARALITGLDKLHRQLDPTYRRGLLSHVCVEAVRTASILTTVTSTAVSGVVFGTEILSMTDFEDNTYDPPGERFARIKNDLVQTLKNHKLPADMRKQILADIEVIDALRQDVKDRMSFITYIWVAISPARRHQYTQQRFQQELEKLVNNDLFVHASKLSNLAGVGTK